MPKKAAKADPRRLRPGELLRLLNSSPLGEVISERQLLRHRQRAGAAIGDESTIDLFAYIGWLVRQRHFPPEAPQRPEASADEGYEAHKQRARYRAATLSQSGRELSAIPPPADPQRREQAIDSLRNFCETYFPHVFALAWSPDHLRVIGRMETVAGDGGLFALAMPRGSGKTSLCEVAALWSLLSGRRKFLCLIGASKPAAVGMLGTIKTELETNELLAADFPEVCLPFRALEGLANRAPGQLYLGERTHIVYGRDHIVLPTIPGSIASGGVLRTYGLNCAIRGAKFRTADGQVLRPDLVILDDPQTDQSAHSDLQCATRERLISSGVLGLAGPNKTITAIMPCTVARAGDLADRFLDRHLHPQWQGERCKLLYSFPSDLKLWSEYAEIRAEEKRADGDGRKATAFYRKNRKAMDAGAVPAWPERFRDGELSAVQYAMHLWIDDPVAFASEYQNEPIVDEAEDEEQFTPTLVVARAIGLARGIVPLNHAWLTSFTDVQGKLLYWVTMSWREDFTGHVVDYGTWPDQQRPYFTLREAARTIAKQFPGAGLEGRLLSAMQALDKELLEREFKNEAGAAARIERAAIDANWGKSTDIVYQHCRQSTHAALLLPSHGKYVGARSLPFALYKRQPGDRVGHHWRIPSAIGRRAIRHLLIDTNYWKSFLLARMHVAIGDPGAVTLFGKPGDHRLFADHLAAEKGQAVSTEDRSIVEWRAIPGRDNHWLDGIVGCAVLASLLGANLMGEASSRRGRSGGTRMKLSDMQRSKGRR